MWLKACWAAQGDRVDEEGLVEGHEQGRDREEDIEEQDNEEAGKVIPSAKETCMQACKAAYSHSPLWQHSLAAQALLTACAMLEWRYRVWLNACRAAQGGREEEEDMIEGHKQGKNRVEDAEEQDDEEAGQVIPSPQQNAPPCRHGWLHTVTAR